MSLSLNWECGLTVFNAQFPSDPWTNFLLLLLAWLVLAWRDFSLFCRKKFTISVLSGFLTVGPAQQQCKAPWLHLQEYRAHFNFVFGLPACAR
jgi:hypothetical protein